MVDYTRNISASTTLMIRDTGGNVEFWVRTGPSTYNYDQQWSFFANGGDSGVRKFRMLTGGAWQKMGEVYVGYDQDVRLTIFNAGLGFPTYDFWQHITRSTVPGPPYIWDTHAISSSHIHVQFNGGYDGGSPVVEWQIGYSSNPSYAEGFWSSSGSSDVGPFSPGQRVYFWARGRNAIGWGGWSNRTEATTWRVPDAPAPVSFSEVTQVSLLANFQDAYDGGTPITARQIGYGLSSSAPTTTVSATAGDNAFSGLSPGKTYYFWARSQNSVGWGAWSPVAQIDLIAGARVFTGGQWKRAVPYIKVGGTWKVGRPWIRNAGTWKETSL